MGGRPTMRLPCLPSSRRPDEAVEPPALGRLGELRRLLRARWRSCGAPPRSCCSAWCPPRLLAHVDVRRDLRRDLRHTLSVNPALGSWPFSALGSRPSAPLDPAGPRSAPVGPAWAPLGPPWALLGSTPLRSAPLRSARRCPARSPPAWLRSTPLLLSAPPGSPLGSTWQIAFLACLAERRRRWRRNCPHFADSMSAICAHIWRIANKMRTKEVEPRGNVIPNVSEGL